MTPLTGPATVRGKPMLGRFAWKDAKLTLAFGTPGGERPADLKGGKDIGVIVLERVIKK